MSEFSIVGDHIVGEVFDGEAIIIDTVTGAYYSLPEGPADVWAALTAGPATLHTLTALSGIDSDIVEGVLGEVVAAGLVAFSGDAPPPAPSGTGVLVKYSDMEELLLLDPIHDVSPAGWPAAGNTSAE